MKKRLALLLVTLMLFTAGLAAAQDLGAYFKSFSDDELLQLLEVLTQEIQSRNLSAPDNAPAASGTLGRYTVSILEAELCTSESGKDCIAITFEWTHTKDEAQSFLWSFYYTAYQNGIELDQAFDVYGMPFDNSLKTIKAGATLKTQIFYELLDLEGDIEIELTEYQGETDEMISTFFYMQ